MTAQARRLLVEFLIDLRSDLESALFEPSRLMAPSRAAAPTLTGLEVLPEDVMQRLGSSLVEPDLVELYRTAWTENMERRFDDLIAAIAPAETADADADGQPELDEQDPLDRLLAAVGLVGSELRMKLGGFRHFRLLERLPGSRKAQDSSKRPKVLDKWMTRGLNRFGRELKFGELILGSLCTATGLAEPVKEFVEAVHGGLRTQ